MKENNPICIQSDLFIHLFLVEMFYKFLLIYFMNLTI